MIAPDMATMLAFVVTDAALPTRVLQPLLRRGDRRLVQRDHGRQRHLDLGHAAAVRDRGGAQPAVTDPKAPALADFRAALAKCCCSIWRTRSCATARVPQKFIADHGRGSPTTLGPADRPRDRQLAPGQDRDRRRRRQLGPGRHGGRQVRRAHRDEPARRRLRRPRGRARRCCRRRARRGAGGSATWPAARSRSGSWSAPGRGWATVWTCDLTHGYIDINADYRS